MFGVEMTACASAHLQHLFSGRHLPAAEAETGYVYFVVDRLTNTTSRGLPFMGPENIVEFPLATCPLHSSRSSIPGIRSTPRV